MPLKVADKREDRRYTLPTGAEIEFDVPDGGRYRLQLLNIGALPAPPYCLTPRHW